MLVRFPRAYFYDRAVADYSRLIKFNPIASNYRQRGEAYLAMENYEATLADYSTDIKFKPDDHWNYMEHGKIYFELGRYAETKADFAKVGISGRRLFKKNFSLQFSL